RTAYPAVRLVLHETSTQQQIDALVDGRLQIGFLRSSGMRPGPPKTLTLSTFGREEMVLVLRRDHKLARTRPQARLPLARLANEPLIVFPRSIGGGTYDQIVPLCRAAGFEPKIAQEAREAVTVLGLVAAGFGITMVAAAYEAIVFEGLTIRRVQRPA